MSNATQPSVVPQPPPPPRDLTPAARRRSWGEPFVRLWWMLAVVLAAVAVHLTAGNLFRAARDAALIRRGELVTTVIERLNGERGPHFKLPPGDNHTAKFTIKLSNGKQAVIEARLEHQTEWVYASRALTLRVDPADPNVWTDRLRIDWLAEMTAGLMMLPLVLVLLGVALLRRRAALAVWRDQPAVPGVVMEVGNSPLAPRSRLVRLSPGAGRETRVITTTIPTRAGELRRGDTLWLVMDPRRPDRAVVAMLYQ